MFGLMKSRLCAHSEEQKNRRRLHYCGTCKTMGSLYGQKSRLLLNFDTVFLGELLTALSRDSKVEEWNKSYQSYNCLNLPQSADAMPLSLQVAATATLVLTEFKVLDQITDSRRMKWRLAQRVFSPSFQSASAKLKEWGFPVETLRECLRTQESREASARRVSDPDSILDSLAFPTATATGLFFGHGARIVAAGDDLSTLNSQLSTDIGRSFGELVYLLDAFEDYEKDSRRRSFNALRAAYGIEDKKLPKACRDRIIARMRVLASRIESGLKSLPIPAAQAAQFAARLNSNLSAKFGIALPMSSPPQRQATPSTPVRVRWRQALGVSGTVLHAHTAAHPSIVGRLQAPFIFGTALMIALIFPAQARTATSYRECVDIGLNLMLIGSVVGAIVTAPLKILPVFSNLTPGPTHSRSVRRVRRDGGPACMCFCCPDDCCTACCIAEMCSECSCEACSCCEACGSGCDCCA